MSSFSLNPISFFRNLTATAPKGFSFGFQDQDSLSGVLFRSLEVNKLNQSSARGLKIEVKKILSKLTDSKSSISLRMRIEINAHSKKSSEKTLEILKKTFASIPFCERFGIISKSMRDEDVACLLHSLSAAPRKLILDHQSSMEMGVLPMAVISELLVRQEDPLLNLSLSVERMSHHAFYNFTQAIGKTTSLSSFEIENFEFSPAQLELLAAGLIQNASISELILSDCKIPQADGSFFQAILKADSQVQRLILRACSDLLLRDLAEALPHASQLAELEIEGCKERDPEGEEIRSFITALGTAPSLQALSLQGVGLNTEETKFLAKSLEKHPTLTDLNLTSESLYSEMDNPIEDEGLIELAQMLRVNSVLKRLDLQGNELGKEAVIEMVSSLEVNRSIEDILGLMEFAVGEEVREELMPIVKRLSETNETLTFASAGSTNDLEAYLQQCDAEGAPRGIEHGFADFILRNRSNQVQKQVSLLGMMLNAVYSAERSESSSSSHFS